MPTNQKVRIIISAAENGNGQIRQETEMCPGLT